MTTCGQIGDFIESMFPLKYAMEWDNVGLLAGYKDQSVERAMLCLDVTGEITKEAIESGCQMIISHHPLIFKPLSKVSGENHVQDTVYKAIRHGLCIYSAHTNMDCAHGGTNDMMADLLGLKDVKPFQKSPDDDSDGIGRFGVLEDESFLYEFIGLLKTLFNTRSVR
ncbi:MAG TPA: Nif3-like dinuclear metal center hexameric protein, partial [Clostridiales bacterium]|nr:Nif3-like dinuclear metal center hexameric protein [Clostridiales bacterium]